MGFKSLWSCNTYIDREFCIEEENYTFRGQKVDISQKRLHKFTSDDITTNYKITLRRGFLCGKNKYVYSFIFCHIVGKIK
jgi:hypothetical protein